MRAKPWPRTIRSWESRGLKCPVCDKPVTQAVLNEVRNRWEYKHASNQRGVRTRYCFGERLEK